MPLSSLSCERQRGVRCGCVHALPARYSDGAFMLGTESNSSKFRHQLICNAAAIHFSVRPKGLQRIFAGGAFSVQRKSNAVRTGIQRNFASPRSSRFAGEAPCGGKHFPLAAKNGFHRTGEVPLRCCSPPHVLNCRTIRNGLRTASMHARNSGQPCPNVGHSVSGAKRRLQA